MIEGIIYLQVTCMSCICCPLSASHGVKGLVCLSLRMQRCRRPGSGFSKGFLLAQGNTPKYRMQKTPEIKQGRKQGNLPDHMCPKFRNVNENDLCFVMQLSLSLFLLFLVLDAV